MTKKNQRSEIKTQMKELMWILIKHDTKSIIQHALTTVHFQIEIGMLSDGGLGWSDSGLGAGIFVLGIY